MNAVLPNTGSLELSERLATSGLRITAQRQRVFDILLQKRDHPTAEEVFMRVKQTMPEISIATVYNCLDALVTCNLVRQLKLDRGAARYCPNMSEHFHFSCEHCGEVFDIEVAEVSEAPKIRLPSGFQLARCEVSLHGACPNCKGKDLSA